MPSLLLLTGLVLVVKTSMSLQHTLVAESPASSL